ncbi:NADH-quinone oxidoreductase subunit NuoK [Marinobacteraceae bacterium S3BR75-40.1]
MSAIPFHQAMALAAILFALGATGLMLRRNIVFVLMSLEIMLNAAGLAFVVAGARWEMAEGQLFFILVLTLAAAEVAIGLALMLQMFRHFRSLNVDLLKKMRG